ncbi:glycosyltransferase family 2 protein [Rubripirellula amarantea]|nr:glycosyltransferase family 2 protein [Rubripirellula amarantea]
MKTSSTKSEAWTGSPKAQANLCQIFADVVFVIPTFNEQESVGELASQIKSVCEANSINFKIVFVDDGSSDESWNVIERLSTETSQVVGLRLRRNFGKAAALEAGIRASSGELIITMDADLQDDPQEIPWFLTALGQASDRDGKDVVSGWKRVRHDPWHKLLPSRAFNFLVSRLTGVHLHDHNCGFKAYRREVFDDVHLYGERHRFVPVLAASKGWRIGEIEVKHHARKFGHSKYGLSRLLKGFLDLLSVYLITGYSGRPFHLIGTGGMVCFGLGGLGIVYLSTMWCLTRLIDSMPILHLHETAIFYYCILAMLLGSQFLLAGLLAELLVSRTSQDHLGYSISERTDSRLRSEKT